MARAIAVARPIGDELAFAQLAAETPSPLEGIESAEKWSAVMELLELLTPDEKLVIVRTILEENTLEEVALEIDVSTGRAHQLKTAGLRRLRSLPQTQLVLS
jgi:RNA polymerase sigma factor (sigma-70 family)